MNEEWRTIPGFESYQASNMGRIRHGARILKASGPLSDGYFRVSLARQDGVVKQRSIHILIAQAFIPNPKGLPTVNHKDGIKANSTVVNLEWRTRAGQMRHAMLLGLVEDGIQYCNWLIKRPWRARYHENGKSIQVGMFETKELARAARKAVLEKLPYVE